MKQKTLAMVADAQPGFEQHRKPTRRDEFLKTMDALVPWAALCEEIAPHYPKAGNGRPAKLNGHNPYTYHKDVLTRLPTQRDKDIGALMPHRWSTPV